VIEPIETSYAGCRFRSRLEARWAVFFDRLGMKWDYEKQGYEFGGVRYLPDFYLPESDAFVEVKGDEGDLRESLPALRRFAREVRKHVVILGDVPRVGPSSESPVHPCLYLINGELVAVASLVMLVPSAHFVPVMVSLGMERVTTQVQRLGVHLSGRWSRRIRRPARRDSSTASPVLRDFVGGAAP
jgi:hypothetical protein